jgi:branched-chain amino acid transport system substrate-binding protein
VSLALRFFLISTIVAAVCVAAAGARSTAVPGVTPKEVKLGSTVPLSGEAQVAGNVARGADAYFKYVNAKGGVLGRKIVFKYLDDGYDPARALTNTVRLVQQDQVFAMFSPLGTNNNLAIRKFLNQQGVPQLFVGSGATTFGRDYRQYPWTIGYLPPGSAEGELYAKYILAHVRRPRIAVLYEDDEDGRDLLGGLRSGLGVRAGAIVGKVGYNPSTADVQPQIAQLKTSGANVFCIFAFGKFALQAFNGMAHVGWRPLTFVNGVSASSTLMSSLPQKAANGAMSIVFGKDPANPMWKHDRGIKLFRRIMRRYGGGISPNNLSDGYFVAGMASAFTMVDALKKAGRNLTRQSVMRSVIHLNERGNPFVLPGAVVRTTPTLRFPLTQVRLQRWNAGAWRPFGRLLALRP